MKQQSNAAYDYSRCSTPSQYGTWEHNYCGRYRDHTRIYERDERADMPMPDEIALSKLNKYRAMEVFYARTLLNCACNGWYKDQAEDMAHLLKCLDDYREKRAEAEAIYNQLHQDLMARIAKNRGK